MLRLGIGKNGLDFGSEIEIHKLASGLGLICTRTLATRGRVTGRKRERRGRHMDKHTRSTRIFDTVVV